LIKCPQNALAAFPRCAKLGCDYYDDDDNDDDYGDNNDSNNKHILVETNQLINYIRLYVIIKNGTHQQESVPPSINVDLAPDVEPIRSCHACGSFLDQNPLVKRGLIPDRLGDILIPPPMPPSATRQPSAEIVTAGRVISGDEMLRLSK